jgi:peptidoglycan/LPS O-acetylase OafA/YrhL
MATALPLIETAVDTPQIAVPAVRPRPVESPNFDLLRSVAVLAVLADHLAGTFGFAQEHLFFWALGRWGVLLFFVHTSYVLMMSMGRLGLSGMRLHATFYIRRFFRIYPLSMLVVAIVVAARIPETSWAKSYNYPDRGTIYSNYLLCQNLLPRYSLIGPLWSLPYEVQMYLLLPAIFLLARKAKGRLLAALWFGSVALGSVHAWLGSAYGKYFQFERLRIAEFIPCFLVGVIAYHILSKNEEARLPFWIWPMSLVMNGVVYLRWNASVGFAGYPEWVCCLGVGLVVAYCAESKYRWLNFLTQRVAKYSYGLYLAQVPVLWLVFVKLRYFPALLKWPLFLFMIVALPFVSYHLIEHSFVKVGATVAERVVPRQ